MKHKYYTVVFCLCILSFLTVLNGTAVIKTETISIIQVTQNCPQLMITLDYDFNAAPIRGSNNSLVVLTLYSLPSDNGMRTFEGTLLFIRTDEGDKFFFWTLGDPFTSSVVWQPGIEMEHFQVDQNELSLIFIEFSQCNNPELEIVVLAKILEIGSIDNTMNNFQEILFSFVPDLPIYSDTSSTMITTTTSMLTESSTATSKTTTTSVSPGFEWFIVLSIGCLVIGVRKRKKVS